MDIVVSDTNIFLDLMSVGILSEAFRLPIRFHTVDYVVEEIKNDEQIGQIMRLVDTNLLTVKEFDEEEISEILSMYLKCSSNLSVEDCSVWYYSKKNNYRLLTGDKALRSCATNDGVMVSGILYITDLLVEEGIIDKRNMASRLRLLCEKNKRLPRKLIEERINKYEG